MGRAAEKLKARKEGEDRIFRRLSPRWHRTEAQESPREDLLPSGTARPALEARALAGPVGTGACPLCGFYWSQWTQASSDGGLCDLPTWVIDTVRAVCLCSS